MGSIGQQAPSSVQTVNTTCAGCESSILVAVIVTGSVKSVGMGFGETITVQLLVTVGVTESIPSVVFCTSPIKVPGGIIESTLLVVPRGHATHWPNLLHTWPGQ